MREDDKAWSIILGKIYDNQRKIVEKIYNYISLKPPYSASVTTILRCYTRVRNDIEFNRFDALPHHPNMIIGLIFDFAGKVVLEGYPPPENYRVKRLKDDESVYLIHADPDAIVNDEVYELKYTSTSFENLPLEHHVYQLKMYMNILHKKGRLIYLTPYGVREFLYEKDEALSDEEMLQFAKKFFVEKASPRFEWECTYCPYKVICPLSKYPRTSEESTETGE